MKLRQYCILIIGLNLFASYIHTQSLTISYGPVETKSKTISPLINESEDHTTTTAVAGISYEHFLKNKHLSIMGSYFMFSDVTWINYAIGGYLDPWGNPIGGSGWRNVNVHRLDLAACYNITKFKRYYLKPFGGIGLQASIKNDWGLLVVPVSGPDYIQTEPMIAEAYNTFQVVPTAGIKTGWVFWKRLDIGFTVQGVYGYKTYQKLTLKYAYKGVVQPDAIYGSNGTGIFYTLGIGYRFARWIKSK
jgi:hypothetical protein